MTSSRESGLPICSCHCPLCWLHIYSDPTSSSSIALAFQSEGFGMITFPSMTKYTWDIPPSFRGSGDNRINSTVYVHKTPWKSASTPVSDRALLQDTKALLERDREFIPRKLPESLLLESSKVPGCGCRPDPSSCALNSCVTVWRRPSNSQTLSSSSSCEVRHSEGVDRRVTFELHSRHLSSIIAPHS